MRPTAFFLAFLLALPVAAAETPSLAGFFHQQGSGTSLMPTAAPMEMRRFNAGTWHVMLHGVAFGTQIQQSGPRGNDDVFSTNRIMAAAQKEMWGGAVQFRTMLSLEPATIKDKRYPLLFQTGETADGRAPRPSSPPATAAAPSRSRRAPSTAPSRTRAAGTSTSARSTPDRRA